MAGTGASDASAVQSAIKADEKKWNDQFKSKDLEGLLSHYADDAYFIAPGVNAADGSTAIRKAYAEGLNDKNFDINFASDKIDVAASGDLAYARGHLSEKYTDPKTGQVMSHTGSYSRSTRSRPTAAGSRWRTLRQPIRAARSRSRPDLSPSRRN